MSPAEEINTDGVSSTDFFETIGHQVEQVAPQSDVPGDEEDEPRVVEEIESLCMNCHENVRSSYSPIQHCIQADRIYNRV